MKQRVWLVLLLLALTCGCALAQGAADRAATRFDASRSQTQSRYGSVGNEPQTETTVTPPRVTTVTVPDNSKAKIQGFAAGQAKPVKKIRVVVPGTVTTVTKPAPVRANPY